MKVLDARSVSKFDELCACLAEQVISSGFKPDIVVGIARGGSYVVTSMTLLGGLPQVHVKAQRAGTKVKTKLKLEKIVSLFPSWFANTVRILEVYYREFSFLLKGRSAEQREAIIVDGHFEFNDSANSILIVDDAVDSGSTMVTVESLVREVFPQADIKVAAICTTFRNPICQVDYVLYKRAIVKFPWSLDS
ncbi:phosphoribosyltransferase [Zhongshania marina]|uniref:Phosphoribosyltransferase domain-containing protein n=1 Tax=Zhongshania marina TaxID=2304603 RepID=A0A2S4HE05_9GAMM|nr:phosphoribosyltransferase family protein [Marortus luteolus]POP52215.1 hypothetical protein C0068_14545 [Marortus luteolus]